MGLQDICSQMINEGPTVSVEQMRSLLVEIDAERREESDVLVSLPLIDGLSHVQPSTLVNAEVINSDLLVRLRDRLGEVFHRCSIGEDQHGHLRACRSIIHLFCKIMEHLKSVDPVLSLPFHRFFLVQSLFDPLSSLLNDIAAHTDRYTDQDSLMELLNTFLGSIHWYQCDNEEMQSDPLVLPLLHSIVRCLSSPSYEEMLTDLSLRPTHPNPLSEFLLETCPSSIAWCRGPFQSIVIDQLCVSGMLDSTERIYSLFLPTIDRWLSPLINAIYYVTALIRYVAFYRATRTYLREHVQIIDAVLLLFHSTRLIDNVLLTSDFNDETNVIDSAISFLFNLMDESSFVTVIKNNEHFSKEIFLQLKHSRVDRVKLHALMILTKVLDENDLKQLNYIESFTILFMDYLVRAFQHRSHSCEDVHIEQLLASFKGLVFTRLFSLVHRKASISASFLQRSFNTIRSKKRSSNRTHCLFSFVVPLEQIFIMVASCSSLWKSSGL